jgi:hypothetical protein
MATIPTQRPERGSNYCAELRALTRVDFGLPQGPGGGTRVVFQELTTTLAEQGRGKLRRLHDPEYGQVTTDYVAVTVGYRLPAELPPE